MVFKYTSLQVNSTVVTSGCLQFKILGRWLFFWVSLINPRPNIFNYMHSDIMMVLFSMRLGYLKITSILLSLKLILTSLVYYYFPQLEATQELVKHLSSQLADLRDQMTEQRKQKQRIGLLNNAPSLLNLGLHAQERNGN